jgi:hypothetical protein
MESAATWPHREHRGPSVSWNRMGNCRRSPGAPPGHRRQTYGSGRDPSPANGGGPPSSASGSGGTTGASLRNMGGSSRGRPSSPVAQVAPSRQIEGRTHTNLHSTAEPRRPQCVVGRYVSLDLAGGHRWRQGEAAAERDSRRTGRRGLRRRTAASSDAGLGESLWTCGLWLRKKEPRWGKICVDGQNCGQSGGTVIKFKNVDPPKITIATHQEHQ